MIFVYLDSESETDQKAQRLFVSHDTIPMDFIVLYDGDPRGTGVGDYSKFWIKGYKTLTTRRIT